MIETTNDTQARGQVVDTLLIVDWYDMSFNKNDDNKKFDAQKLAYNFNQLAQSFGDNNQCVAITYAADRVGQQVYQQSGYTTISLNGDRPLELARYIEQACRDLLSCPPRQLIVISVDPEFARLFATASSQQTDSALVIYGDTNLEQLSGLVSNVIRLDDLISQSVTYTVDVRIDLENMYYGLGDKSRIDDVIDSIKRRALRLGDIETIAAYADYQTLPADVQHSLLRHGVKICDVVGSVPGKNSADMEMAGDIWQELAYSANKIDKFLLATGDGDFRRSIRDIRAHGKEAHIISLQGSFSHHLEDEANSVRYLEELLGESLHVPLPTDEGAAFAMHFVAFLQRSRRVCLSHSEIVANFEADLVSQLPLAEEAGILTKNNDCYVPNKNHTFVRLSEKLLEWVPWRIQEGSKSPRYYYVSTNYLCNGMDYDHDLRILLGQNNGREVREAWLNLVAETGAVIKQSCTHYKNPNWFDEKWLLPTPS